MRHAADAENLTSFIDSYENELVSTDAMTSEHQDVHKNFATNPTKELYIPIPTHLNLCMNGMFRS